MTTTETVQPVTRYKRRIPVQTLQWTGSNAADVYRFCDDLVGFGGQFEILPTDDKRRNDGYTAQVWDKLHSTWIPMRDGDHVARGVRGELYPIADQIITQAYETGNEPHLYKLTLRDDQGNRYHEHVVAHNFEYDDDSKAYVFDNATGDTAYEVAREVVVDIRDVTDIKAAVREFLTQLGIHLGEELIAYANGGEPVVADEPDRGQVASVRVWGDAGHVGLDATQITSTALAATP